MVNGGPGSQTVGSIIVIDSEIKDSHVFVDTVWKESTWSNGSLILENVSLENVPTAVQASNNTVLEGGSRTVKAWGQGHIYNPSGPKNFQDALQPPPRPKSLLAESSQSYYTKAKPQYENLPVSSFASVRAAGAKGDGSTDDTAALQSVLDSAAKDGKVAFFDQGVYKVTRTLSFPPGSRIAGEAFPVIMASGQTWSDINKPVPVIQIGKAGDTGLFEWSDMLVSTQGSTPGATLIEWNLAANRGSGMWEVHTRIGGFAGSQLQATDCPTSGQVSAKCQAAYMSMHITKPARNVYLDNVWLWTADHDLDDGQDTRISVYTGRGLLVEGQNVRLYVEPPTLHSKHTNRIDTERPPSTTRFTSTSLPTLNQSFSPLPNPNHRTTSPNLTPHTAHIPATTTSMTQTTAPAYQEIATLSASVSSTPGTQSSTARACTASSTTTIHRALRRIARRTARARRLGLVERRAGCGFMR